LYINFVGFRLDLHLAYMHRRKVELQLNQIKQEIIFFSSGTMTLEPE